MTELKFKAILVALFWLAIIAQWIFYRRATRQHLTEDDVEWVVNDIAELGVKIRGQFFFLYKGSSYQGGAKWRHVYKREFGECCHPWTAIELKEYGNIQNRPLVRLPDKFIGYFGEPESEWRDLPFEREDDE